MIEQLPDLLEKYYQIKATDIRQLAGEVDLNFRVTDEEGKRYTLKISRPGADPKAIDFERAVMAHLTEKHQYIPPEDKFAKGLEVLLDPKGKDRLPFTPRPVGEVHALSGGRLLRLQTWMEGRPLSTVTPITAELRRSWGHTLSRLTRYLEGFEHPYAPRRYKWNPGQTLEHRPSARLFTEERRALADFYWDRFERETLPYLDELPRSITYNDGHGDNLLVDEDGEICGVIDFGDAMYTQTICELAIGCAYAAMNVPDPISAITDVVNAYRVGHRDQPHLKHLLNFITARLLITVSVAAENARLEPDNKYLQVSAEPAWKVLERLRDVPPLLTYARFWSAGYHRPEEYNWRFTRWLKEATIHSVVNFTDRTVVPFDLSVGSLDLGNYSDYTDLPAFSRRIRRMLEDKGATFGVGGYGETRPVYTTDDFVAEGNDGPRWRTTHLGVDVWGPAGTPVVAPLDGTVHYVGTDPTEGGYGAVLILEHITDYNETFYTLYGHLSADSVAHLRAGAQVRGGDEIARFGTENENGGWPPHLHFQVMLDLLGYGGEFPGVAFPEEATAWLAICPDPGHFLDTDSPVHQLPRQDISLEMTLKRKTTLGYGLSVSYNRPLHIVRGAGQYLLDVTGRRYLDTVNNVAHVGHEHPAVVRAIQRQAAVLNTNTRYLHEEILAFAEELTATLPDELSVVHFVNSGSEANELALRMCEAHAGTRDMLALEVGYHGNTGRTIDVSSYKFDRKGGKGAPPETTIVPMPDVFRGRHRDPATAGKDYADYVVRAIREAEAAGKRYGGFLAESILSCGGQIVLPEDYLSRVYTAVRAHGGLCVADEVQVGLGRVGSHWWGFELQGVVPDIVVIGKPLGNGHPLGAVVCTPAVAETFNNGMEYFNTFGGNPVSCAAGRAVLRTVREEGLREHARTTGAYLKTSLLQLQEKYPIIGDVRGEGLFLGFELVQPDLAPASAPAKYLKNRMRHLGFLMSTDGPDENVIKIKPPMCFARGNADQLVDYLGRVLQEDRMRL